MSAPNKPLTEMDAGADAYVDRRDKKIARLGSKKSQRGYLARRNKRKGSLREGQYFAPEEQAKIQDAKAAASEKEMKRRKRKVDLGLTEIKSGRTTFDVK